MAKLIRSDRQEETFPLLSSRTSTLSLTFPHAPRGVGELHRNLFQPVHEISFCPLSDSTDYAGTQLTWLNPGFETLGEAREGAPGSEAAVPSEYLCCLL